MSVSTDPRIGAELFGYRIEALVGRGGMGVVYRAYDQRLKRNVALKLIAPELSGDAPFRERFLAETELAASLEHPNVVPIHDAGEVDGQLYIAMRYVEGGELKTLLRKEGRWRLRAQSRSAARSLPRSTPPTAAVSSIATSSPRTCSSTRTSTSTSPTSASAGASPTRAYPETKVSPSGRPPTPPPSRSRAATWTAAQTSIRSAASCTSA